MITREQLLAMAAASRQKKLMAAESLQHSTAGVMLAAPTPVSSPENSAPITSIVWNEEQQAAIDLARAKKEFCLIGAAGTGKTTTVKQIIKELLGQMTTLDGAGNKVVPSSNTIALVSFTNRAVKNIAKAVQGIGAVHHCKTIHTFLRFKPEKFIILDPITGNERTTMRFIPTHNRLNPITECQLVVVDESSMVDTALFALLREATPNARFIFIGDLNQLPPVFGDAILGFKLAELPVIELTRVYRQAMESPIIGFQHRYTLPGKLPSDTDMAAMTAASEAAGNGIYFRPLKKYIEDGEVMAKIFAGYLLTEMDAGKYDPETGNHVVLVPFNKQFGTIELNKHLATALSKRRNVETYEIISGIVKTYLAPGDLVTFNKREWRILSIERNKKYFGKLPRESSLHLNRFGYYTDGLQHEVNVLDALNAEFNNSEELLRMTVGGREDDEETTNQASHVLLLQSVDSDMTCEASTAGEVNTVQLAYCTTIHKSQGSEWEKVYLIMTRHHNVMISRELLYTGMTRAKKDLVVIYSPQSGPGLKDSSIARAVKRQEIPGIGWKAKVEVFKGKAKKNSGEYE